MQAILAGAVQGCTDLIPTVKSVPTEEREQSTRIECGSATSMTLYYGIYRIKLPRGGDYDYCVRLAQAALDSGLSSGKIQEGQGGLLDLTVTEDRARFIPDH